MKKAAIVIGLFLLLPLSVQARSLECLVISVTDGDTLKAQCGWRRDIVRVRLAEIDAPEKSQPYGIRSKQSLAEMCAKRRAVLQVYERDRYDRLVARVYCDDVDVSAEQVRRGMAWVYRQYLRDPGLLRLEDGARWERRGLWADRSPVPPWKFRRGRGR